MALGSSVPALRKLRVQSHDMLYKTSRTSFTLFALVRPARRGYEDHGIPWWSERSPNGATRLTVWLMKQGIRLHWSGYRHPQTQGKVERFHGSLQRALQLRSVPREQP